MRESCPPGPPRPALRCLALRVRWSTALVVFGLVSSFAGPGARPAEAQQRVGTCRVLPGTERAVGRNQGGGRVVYLTRPRLACDSGVTIRADSMVIFEATGFNQLYGSVYFEDPSRRLRSRNARYFDQVGRLEASGAVELTDKESGNVVQGENLLYLRADTRFRRTVEELTVWGGRSHALLFPGTPSEEAAAVPGVRDSVRLGVSAREAQARAEAQAATQPQDTGPREPYDVVADRIFIRGEELFRATGTVEVTRDSLNATADSLQYLQNRERLFLQGEAVLTQARFDLQGDEILLVLPGDTIRSVEARHGSRLVGEDFELDAPRIRLGLTGGALESLWATPFQPGDTLEGPTGPRVLGEELDSLDLVRPHARSSTFDMVADSLEVAAPGEVLERVFAAGRARAVSSGRDSLNTPETPELIRRDWIEGDTVVAFFRPEETAAPEDSTRYVIQRLEARVLARSLYRLEPEQSPPPLDSTLVAAGDSARDSAGDPTAAIGREAADSLGMAAPDSPPRVEGTPPDSLDAAGAARDSLQRSETGAAVPPDSVPAPGGEPTGGAVETGAPGPVTETGISPDPHLAVHYVIADEIVIIFVDGEVERMEVKGLDQGLYLDPTPRRAPTEGGS